MGEEGDEICLREDLVELAGSLQQSSFNVKKFKRKHAAKPIRLSDQRIYSRLQSESSERKQTPHVHSKTFAQGLNSTLRYNETFIPPQKKAKFFAKSQPKSAQFAISPRKHQINELQKYQKLWSNGRMKEKCIQEWLNAVLVEFCHDEFFDKTIANCALKKMGIDENSLVAKGLPAQNVVRLYRSLFVFGMGFNNLLGELAGNRMEVLKTVWRVYSIILEYCSRGGMVTVIGEIEREASAKIAELAGEIQRKQDIIERNEELNEAKNDEIFREVKKLREDNCNLNNQKTVLFQQYNATEQAFSEQVGLRLKFQTKINQIYGLHRDLGIKHQKLFQDLSNKIQQLRVLADKYFQTTIRLQQFRESQYKMKQQLILLRMSFAKQKEFIEGLVKERLDLMGKVSRLEYSLEESRGQIIELRNKEKRWSSEREGIQTMMELRQKSAKETHSEYQMTLQENNRLYILLSDQRKVMEEYEKEKRNFNSKVISIVSENSFHKRKLEQVQRRYDSMIEQAKILQQKRESLELQLQIKSKNEESYQLFFSKNEQNLQQMQRINYANEEQLTFLRKYYKNMQQVLRDKNQSFQNLSVRYDQIKYNLQKVTVQLQETKSKYILLDQQCRYQQQQYRFRDTKLKLLAEQLSTKEQQLQKQRQRFQLEQDRLKTQLDTVAMSYKNQKFQRNTLQNSYLQSLKIMQKKNLAERDQNVKISMQQGMIEQQRKRCKHLQRSMFDLVTEFALVQQNLQETLNLQRNMIVFKESFVHPLVAEDLMSNLIREIEKNNVLTINNKSLKLDLEKQRCLRQQDVERLHQQYRWDINILSKQAEKKIQNLEAELLYQQQETKKVKSKVKELEESNEQLKNKVKSRPSIDRQTVYKNLLEQKKQQLQSLLADMHHLQDELQKARMEGSPQHPSYRSSNNEGISENRTTIDQLNALKRELQHQFGLKLRQLQRQMRSELIKKQQALQQQFSGKLKVLSVEQILRLKQVRPQDALRQISSSIKAGRGIQRIRDATNREQREQRQANSQPKVSRKITRLIKQAYQYYNN